MSQKKSQREPVAEAPSKKTSTSRVDHEPIHAGFEEDEDSGISLRLRSHQTKGLAVIKIEKLSEEVT